jgi:hypothetical protein
MPTLDVEARNTDFKIFGTIDREYVRYISDRLCKYVHKNKIPAVVFIDRAARPAYRAMLLSWHESYPEENAPQIYFVNPHGFETDDRGISTKLWIPHHLRRYDVGEIAKQFESRHRHLTKYKNAPVLIFDVCVHGGETLDGVILGMKEVGFKNLHLVTVRSEHGNAKVPLDIIIIKNPWDIGCYPFGQDKMVEKDRKRVISDRTTVPHWLEHAREIRSEIRAIFEESLMRK